MSPGERCDEILRLLDDALSGLTDLPARGLGERQPASAAGCQRGGSTQRRGQWTQTGSRGASSAALG